MLVIRLKRIGKKNKPYYRLIISEKSKDTQADFLEDLGSYNPHLDPPAVNLKADRIKYWLSQGAQTSNTVHNILVNADLVNAPKRRVVSQGKKKEEKKSNQQASPITQSSKKEEKKAEKPKEAKPAEIKIDKEPEKKESDKK